MSDYNICEDLRDVLHIAQEDRDKWKERALALAKLLGISECDIDREVANQKQLHPLIQELMHCSKDIVRDNADVDIKATHDFYRELNNKYRDAIDIKEINND